jgi:hypothetical protein
MRKIKKYTAMGVWLNVKDELAAPNGSKQFFICVKSTTKKRVQELLEAAGSPVALPYLSSHHGLMENKTYKFDPPQSEEIYFLNENTNTPNFREWLSLSQWKRA